MLSVAGTGVFRTERRAGLEAVRQEGVGVFVDRREANGPGMAG